MNPHLQAALGRAPQVMGAEDAAERAMDRLDARLRRGEISVEQYDAACAALDAWVRA